MTSNHLFLFLTPLLVTYGQIVLKWQISHAGPLPSAVVQKILFLLRRLGNIWILSALIAGVLAVLSWMIAMTRFELSYAYPFMSLSYVLVLGLSALFLHEGISAPKVIGMALIVAGIIIGSQG